MIVCVAQGSELSWTEASGKSQDNDLTNWFNRFVAPSQETLEDYETGHIVMRSRGTSLATTPHDLLSSEPDWTSALPHVGRNTKVRFSHLCFLCSVERAKGTAL